MATIALTRSEIERKQIENNTKDVNNSFRRFCAECKHYISLAEDEHKTIFV